MLCTGVVEMRANERDFRGALVGDMQSRLGPPLDLDLVPNRLRVSRPVIVPFESSAFRLYRPPGFGAVITYIES